MVPIPDKAEWPLGSHYPGETIVEHAGRIRALLRLHYVWWHIRKDGYIEMVTEGPEGRSFGGSSGWKPPKFRVGK